ncbi:hypothetical protein KDW_64470 [Dictyobacter vulcani]|uniref:CBS domain-containing protein n=1 Tax=Dictyobacter vulcani TaxID=2607529 RepID=A0A5J4KWD6_9CHLR|nr:CBS domain-containing protein [Dictyobacter vulcani]GER92285.1 hypothetical protein KDW_64470 [Dictyobacter vulcani]
MIAVSLAYLIVGQQSIYSSQVANRADSPAHRLQFTFPLLARLSARQAMKPLARRLHPEIPLSEAATLFAEQKLRGLPVIDEQENLLGILTPGDIERTEPSLRASRTVGEAMNPKSKSTSINVEDTLDNVLEELTTQRISWAPVIERQPLEQMEHVLGIISITDIMRLYRQTARRGRAPASTACSRKACYHKADHSGIKQAQ